MRTSLPRLSLRAHWLSVVTLVAITTTDGLAQSAPLPSGANSGVTLAALDSIGIAAVRQFSLPGISVAISTTRGAPMYVGKFGYADISQRESVTPETRFRIYSISKVYTAVIAHQLAGTGVIALDAPVGRYLSDLPSWRDSVTLRQLLSHTSGIEDYTDVNGFERAVNAGTAIEGDFVAAALRVPLHFPPGTRWRYSNTGYYLMQRVIERATAEPYGRTLAERVLVPAGLTATSSNCSSSEVATSYTPAWAAGLKGDSLVVVETRNRFAHAAAVGGLCSNSLDLVRFLSALLTGHLLDTASLGDMIRPALSTAPSGAGLFVGDDDEGFIISHSGGSRNGSSLVMAFVRDSLVLAAVTNGGGAELEQLLRSLRRRLLGKSEPVIADLPTTKEQIAQLVGFYAQIDGSGRTIVAARNDTLFAVGGRLRRQADGSYVPDYSTELHLVFRYDHGSAKEVDFVRYGVVEARFRRP